MAENNSSGSKKLLETEDQQRQFAIDHITCVDRKLGFPANLFFDKTEAIADIKSGKN